MNEHKILEIFKQVLPWICQSIIVLIIGSPFWLKGGTAQASLPTEIREVVWQESVAGYVELPDWNQISLSDLPGILRAGSLGTEFNQYVGYDLSRVWQVGDRPDQILKLGDIAEALAPQNFSLGQIAAISGTNLANLALSEFPWLAEQTLSQLVEAVPGLGQFDVGEIAPVAALLGTQSFPFGQRMPLANLLGQNPALGELKLNQIDLSQFSFNSIPNLESSILGDFSNWQSSFVAEVPGLGQVPLGQMPNPVAAAGGIVSRIDSVWSAAESQRFNTVSGSIQEGFSVPCERDCAHIELDDLENSGSAIRGSSEGKQWISGLFQEVEGGSGVLGSVNGGKEPTGRHPFGKAFKVVVGETDETTDQIDTQLYFRFCVKKAFVDLGCTPYFIGPIPFLNYQRDDWIFLGASGLPILK